MDDTDAFPLLFEITVFIFLGLVLGSFSTCLIFREGSDLPWWGVSRRKPESGSRSFCPACRHVLGVKDLFPVLSYLLLKGRCAYCSTPIPAFYPVAELGCLLLCLLSYSIFGFTAEAFLVAAAMPFFIALLFVDWQHYILPDRLMALAALPALANASLGGGYDMLAHSLLSALIYFLVAWGLGQMATRILGRDALGFGDVKFFALAGLWLGLENLPLFMIMSGVFGVAIAWHWKRAGKGEVFPFGPALILSFLAVFLTGGSLFPGFAIDL